MKFTSVVSLHTNPMTCGVAKFGMALAQRLGVPFIGYSDIDESPVGEMPLLSLKWSECELATWGSDPEDWLRGHYGIFWHDKGNARLTRCASVVFHADSTLGPNGLWCPSLLPEPRQRMVRLFSFGMAHKLQTSQFVRVRELLEAAGLDYRLRVSVGLHEGTSLLDATKHFDALKDIMGTDTVTILGCLSDDAVAEELAQADVVLAFFEQGLRLNNTTVHAALDAGCRVITNTDAHTPKPFADRVLSIHQIEQWPDRGAPKSPYTWERLIAEMEVIYAKSTDRQPTHL